MLPIDSLRDHISPMRLLCQRIPRHVIENVTGVRLPIPPPSQPRDRQPTVAELLDSFCRMRGFAAQTHGGFDHPRGSRVLLKDYCEGRLLYAHPPPPGWAAWLTDAGAQTATAGAIAARAAAAAAQANAEATTARNRRNAARAAEAGRFENVLLPAVQRRHNTTGDAKGGAAVRFAAAASAAAGGLTGLTHALDTPSKQPAQTTITAQSAASGRRVGKAAEAAVFLDEDDIEEVLDDGDDDDNVEWSDDGSAKSGNESDSDESDGNDTDKILEVDDDDDDGEVDEKDSDDGSGADVGDDSVELDADVLRAFTRVVPVSTATAVVRADIRGNPDFAIATADAALQAAALLRNSAGPAAAGVPTPEPRRAPKVAGIGRFGRPRKGARAADPYGCEAAADVANRRYDLGEVAAVVAGPAGVEESVDGALKRVAAEVEAAAALPVMSVQHGGGRAQRTSGAAANAAVPVASMAPLRSGVVVPAGGESKAAFAAGGAVYRDIVPAHLRGRVPADVPRRIRRVAARASEA